MRRLLEGYDTDVEPPLTSGESNTTVRFNMNILCASLSGQDYVHFEGLLRMVGIVSTQYTR